MKRNSKSLPQVSRPVHRRKLAHHEVGDDGYEEEKGDAEVVVAVAGDAEAVVERFDPLTAHHSPHEEEGVVEIGEVPPGYLAVVEKVRAVGVPHPVPLLACVSLQQGSLPYVDC